MKAYLVALWRYWQTPKGRHDLFDDLRALAIMLLVMLAVYGLWRHLDGAW